jgi:methyl-accepting chemotaxis protein
MIQATEAAIAVVGDSFSLILDPDLDSFSLIEVAILALPRLQSRLASLVSDPRFRDPHRRLTFDERAQLLVWAAVLREEGERVGKGAQKAIDVDPKFYGVSPSLRQVLPSAVQTFTIELETLVLSLGELAKPDAPAEQITALEALAGRVSEEGFEVWRAVLGEADKLLQIRQHVLERRRWTAILAMLAAFTVSTSLVLLIIWNITRPLHDLVAFAQRIATGDLTGELALGRRDEIGTLGGAISAMTRSLASLVGKVQGAGVQIASTATEVAAAARQQETLVAELETSTTRVAAAVNEISATAEELAAAMQRVRHVASDTERLAGLGRTGLAEMESGMRRLLTATDTVSASLAEIRGQAAKVGEVTTTMTKVADQTNLLSLNASIESERLGEQGRGVAVVAREVRRLADQTAVATLDIERMMAEMHAAVSAGVREAASFTGEMRQGVERSAQVGQGLGEIIRRITELAPQFESVASGVQAQSLGARQIREAVAELTEGARQAADALRHFNEAASHLRASAQNLRSEVDGFRI